MMYIEAFIFFQLWQLSSYITSRSKMMHILASFYVFYEYFYELFSSAVFAHWIIIDSLMAFIWQSPSNETSPGARTASRSLRQNCKTTYYKDWQGTITTANLCKPQITKLIKVKSWILLLYPFSTDDLPFILLLPVQLSALLYVHQWCSQKQLVRGQLDSKDGRDI